MAFDATPSFSSADANLFRAKVGHGMGGTSVGNPLTELLFLRMVNTAPIRCDSMVKSIDFGGDYAEKFGERRWKFTRNNLNS